jgi:hypothetical protein
MTFSQVSWGYDIPVICINSWPSHHCTYSLSPEFSWPVSVFSCTEFLHQITNNYLSLHQGLGHSGLGNTRVYDFFDLLWKTQRMWSVGSVWDQARSWHGVGMWFPNQQILSQNSAWRGIISVILLYCFMWMIPKVRTIFPFSQWQLYSTWSIISSICNVCHICKLSYNATTSSYCVLYLLFLLLCFFEHKWKKIHCKERSHLPHRNCIRCFNWLNVVTTKAASKTLTCKLKIMHQLYCTVALLHLLDFETFHQELLYRHCAIFR